MGNALIVAGIMTLFTASGVFYMVAELPPDHPNIATGWALAIGVLVLAIVFIVGGYFLRKRE
jgi:VIT1/CCC1 family predicted Fe2+/Mn2+ transporter